MSEIGRIVLEFNHFDQLAAAFPSAVGRIVWRSANRIRAHAMNAMTGPKSGRLYKKGAITKTLKLTGRKWRAYAQQFVGTSTNGRTISFTVGYKTHRASAPGEAPAIDTGNLRASISAEMAGQTTAFVSVNSEHGIWLEYGTRKMAKRPFMRPAVDAERTPFTADMMNLEGELKR